MTIAKTLKQERRAAQAAEVEAGKRKARQEPKKTVHKNPNPKISRKAKPLVLD
jgi:hypothetical protein